MQPCNRQLDKEQPIKAVLSIAQVELISLPIVMERIENVETVRAFLYQELNGPTNSPSFACFQDNHNRILRQTMLVVLEFFS